MCILIVTLFLAYFFGSLALQSLLDLLCPTLQQFSVDLLICPGILILAGFLGYIYFHIDNWNLLHQVKYVSRQERPKSKSVFHLEKLENDYRFYLYKEASKKSERKEQTKKRKKIN